MIVPLDLNDRNDYAHLTAFGIIVGVGEVACLWRGYRRRGLVAPDARRDDRGLSGSGLAEELHDERSSARQLARIPELRNLRCRSRPIERR
jgi:hypothetical protein